MLARLIEHSGIYQRLIMRMTEIDPTLRVTSAREKLGTLRISIDRYNADATGYRDLVGLQMPDLWWPWRAHGEQPHALSPRPPAGTCNPIRPSSRSGMFPGSTNPVRICWCCPALMAGRMGSLPSSATWAARRSSSARAGRRMAVPPHLPSIAAVLAARSTTIAA